MTGYPTVAAPSNLTAAVEKGGGKSRIVLNWQDNSDNETDFNARFQDVNSGFLKTWHAGDENATSCEIPISTGYGIPPGTYDVTLYAAGYYTSTDPSLPSTNLWSGPSNTVRLEVSGGGGDTGGGKGKPQK